MDLGDPLTRYAFIKEGQRGKRWFVGTIHHVLYDGWSLPRIVDAVTTIYNGGTVEKQPDFHAFIQYLGQQDPEASALYWQSALALTARRRRSLRHYRWSSSRWQMRQYPINAQRFPITRSDTTTSTLVRAAWAIIASRYTNSDDVVFGATVTGRHAPVAGEIEAMIGTTIATVPVRARVWDDQLVSAFLRAMQQQSTEMIPYEQTGLQRISKLGADAQHACGFQTLLVVQPVDNISEDEDDKELGRLVWQLGDASLRNVRTGTAVYVGCRRNTDRGKL